MGLHATINRITKVFCYAILGVTLAVLTLRLTVFKDLAVTGGAPSLPESGGSGEISGGGDFPYSFNGKIYFPTALEKGNVLVQNPQGNTYLLSIDIVDDASNKSLYYTGAVEPGEKIDTDSLSAEGKKLENGVYQCTAKVAALSPADYLTVQSEEIPVAVYVGEKPK